MHRLSLYLLIVFLVLGTTQAQDKTPQVVASIPPIYSLVAGVMDGVATPQLLIPGNLSPHTYSLRPSDARLLQHADLIFWIGRLLETNLVKPLRTLAPHAKIIEIGQNSALLRLPYRSSSHEHAHSGSIDPHLWLDPLNAQIIVRQISRELTELDPKHAALYHQNELNLVRKLDQLHERLKISLTPLKQSPFMVLHDAYQYLEFRYDLKRVETGIVSHDFLIKPLHLAQIEKQLKDKKVQCVFQEPQFKVTYLSDLFTRHNIRVETLDPLGANLPLHPESYFVMMQTLVGQLERCLTRSN